MLKITLAAIFAATLADAGAAAACLDRREEASASDHRFTRYEAPNHRHLLRYQQTRRAE